MRNKGRVKMIKDHDFYCTQCGKREIPICRTSAKSRESGHLKRIYCFTCGDETNHVECVEGSRYCYWDFKEEFEAGNFTQDGSRKLSISKFHVFQTSEYYNESENESNIDAWLDLFCACS